MRAPLEERRDDDGEWTYFHGATKVTETEFRREQDRRRAIDEPAKIALHGMLAGGRGSTASPADLVTQAFDMAEAFLNEADRR